MVDGGKGQLGMACGELQKLGLHEMPIIGLAKEFEEIYRPGRPAPLRLPEDSGALRLLQRIRDEAHRFANGYHQLLMNAASTRASWTIAPGVSENRKQLLLKAFRLGGAAAQEERRADRRRGRHQPEAGRGRASISYRRIDDSRRANLG